MKGLPGPCLIGVSDPCLIEHVLIVPEADRIIVLGKGIGMAVILIQFHDFRVIITQIRVGVFLNVIRQIQKDSLVHVFLRIL